MSKRIFVTFLGTGKYEDAQYYFEQAGQQERYKTRFVADAITRQLLAMQAGLEVVVFLTPDAKARHWDGEHGLYAILRSIDGISSEDILFKDIPHASTQPEIYQLFLKLVDSFAEDSEVFIDITHGFRHIPFMTMPALAYARALRPSLRIGGIYYGAFDARQGGSQQHGLKASTPAMDTNHSAEVSSVPIWNLKGYAEINEWSVAVDRFIQVGDAKPLAKLIGQAAEPRSRESKGQDKVAFRLNGLAKNLQLLTSLIGVSALPDIPNLVTSIKESLTQIEEDNQFPILEPLLSKLAQQIYRIEIHSPIRLGVSLAEWCLECDRLQAGVTIMQESIISHFVPWCEGGGVQEREVRELISKVLSQMLRIKTEEGWTGQPARYPEIRRRLLERLNKMPFWSRMFCKLTECRNKINHANCTEQEANRIFETLRLTIEKVRKILEEEPIQ
jgi:CRISPR-associated DxTHG motif protein